jgi:hypothetical protein
MTRMHCDHLFGSVISSWIGPSVPVSLVMNYFFRYLFGFTGCVYQIDINIAQILTNLVFKLEL